MKFTPQNFRAEFPKFGITDADMKKRFDLASKSKPEDYNNSEVVKRMIDLFVSQLNQRYGKSDKVGKKQIEKEIKKKPLKHLKNKKTTFKGQFVEKISPEVAIIKRFTHLQGKSHKDIKDSAIRLLNTLQKSITEKSIRKTSEYASEIMAIQDNLLIIVNKPQCNDIIDIEKIEHYKQIALSEKVSDEVSIIKKYLQIQGKEGVKDKARMIEELIAKSGLETRIIKDIYESVFDYTHGNTSTPEASAQTLKGLYGLAGIDSPAIPSGTSISANQFIAQNFDTYNFTGKWKDLIGLPSKNFKIMIYGKAGEGKSTLALKFANYLASTLGKKVLYIANEEKFGYTLHEKVVRLNINSPNLYFIDTMPDNSFISKYDIIFMDSVNTLALDPENLESMPHSKAYVYVFQATKDGNYRGSQAFEHLADSVINIENMTARTTKNRFGGSINEIPV